MAKFTNADYLHNHDVYFPKRAIVATGEVNLAMYNLILKNLMILDRGGQTITILLNSEGGDITSCRGIYSAIRECKDYVRIIVYGEANSAASIILQAADERIMMPDSEMMIHLGEETYPSDHPRNIDSLHTHFRRSERWMKKIYLEKIKNKKPRFTKEKLEELLRFDKHLTPRQALDLGLIDLIGE